MNYDWLECLSVLRSALFCVCGFFQVAVTETPNTVLSSIAATPNSAAHFGSESSFFILLDLPFSTTPSFPGLTSWWEIDIWEYLRFVYMCSLSTVHICNWSLSRLFSNSGHCGRHSVLLQGSDGHQRRCRRCWWVIPLFTVIYHRHP